MSKETGKDHKVKQHLHLWIQIKTHILISALCSY